MFDQKTYESMDQETKFRYLGQKLWQHTGNNISKTIFYWRLLIKLDFRDAPEDLMPIYKSAKEYIKKELLI